MSEAEEDIVFEYLGLVNDLNLFPEIDITAPSASNFANGVETIDVTYTVFGNADSID
ncbi:MAG: hypothetical protein ACJA1H_002304 [Glaciecola sp.]